MVRYIVVNENTLGYVDDTASSLVGVLAGSVIRGGHKFIDGPFHVSPRDAVRSATLADFDAYRVEAPAHLAAACERLCTEELDTVSDEDLADAAAFYDRLVSGQLYEEEPPKLFPR